MQAERSKGEGVATTAARRWTGISGVARQRSVVLPQDSGRGGEEGWIRQQGEGDPRGERQLAQVSRAGVVRGGGTGCCEQCWPMGSCHG